MQNCEYQTISKRVEHLRLLRWPYCQCCGRGGGESTGRQLTQ